MSSFWNQPAQQESGGSSRLFMSGEQQQQPTSMPVSQSSMQLGEQEQLQGGGWGELPTSQQQEEGFGGGGQEFQQQPQQQRWAQKTVPEMQRTALRQHPAYRPLLPATEPVLTHAPVVERKQESPIVQEFVENVERIEIQPIIHRQRDRVEIRPVLQPLHERVVNPITVEESQLAPERREIHEQGGGALEWRPVSLQPCRRMAPVRQEQVVQQPIVHETIQTRVIEDIQPVIEREVLQTRVVKTVKPIYEHVVECPRLITTQYEQPRAYTTSQQQQQQPQRNLYEYEPLGARSGGVWPKSGRTRRYQ